MVTLLNQIADYTYDYNTGTSSGSGAGANAFVIILYGLAIILVIAGIWKTFKKAGKPGWAAIVPFYGQWVLAEISGNPGWYGLLLWVPIANIVFNIVISLGIAKNFGKSAVFGIFGLWIFSIIGYPMLGFGSAPYKSPASPTGRAAPKL